MIYIFGHLTMKKLVVMVMNDECDDDRMIEIFVPLGKAVLIVILKGAVPRVSAYS